ncbi:MAG: G8 domain-containing protein [Actinomycetota bacterium]
MPPMSTRSLRRPALLAAAGALALSACASGTRANDAAPAAPVAETDHQHRADHRVDHRADHRADHYAALALVDPDLATHTAVASGDWRTPGTWASGVVPGEGSRVVIPAGIAVTVDGVLSPAIKTIGIDGMLRFAPDVDTELRVDTVVSAPGGALEIGTSTAPIDIAATARLTFADDGPIDRRWDPALLSRGAVLYGTTTIHGTAPTHRTTVASFPRAGDASVALNEAPEGWRAGDQLVITGTDGPTSDEVRTITRVDGSTVVLDRPLDADHVPPADDLDLYVANLSRNVVVSSENPAIDRRGHLMIAHTLDAEIHGARFSEMGRTDKSRELDDVEFVDIEPGAVGWTGEFTTLGGTNVRGRYSVHFHRGGAHPTSGPAVIADSVVTGDPGWAFTNHSSHVDFLRNVAYDNAGAGFFTEAGDETGRWIDNIAIRSVMPNFTLGDEGAIDPDVRADRQDFGIDGDGFWLQGNRVDLVGNVAAGSSAHGIIWWSEGLAEADLGQVSSVDVASLPDPSLIPDCERIPVWWAPLGEVRDNVAYGATVGFRARYIHGATYLEDPAPPPAAYIDTLQPVIDGMTAWDVRDGILMNYNERLTLRNVRAIGRAEPFRHNYGHTAAIGVGLDVGNDATFGPGTIEQIDLRGFEVGVIGPRHGAWTIDDVAIAATTDVLLHAPEHTARSLDIADLTALPLAETPLAGREPERRHVVLAYEYAGDGDGVDPSTHEGDVDPDVGPRVGDRVTLDGVGLYSHGLPGSAVPGDAIPDQRVTNGLVGSPAAVPALTHTPGAGGIGGDDHDGEDVGEDDFDEDDFEEGFDDDEG